MYNICYAPYYTLCMEYRVWSEQWVVESRSGEREVWSGECGEWREKCGLGVEKWGVGSVE